MQKICLTLAVLFLAISTQAKFTVAENGQARCSILQQTGATDPELFAAKELAQTLQKLTGGDFPVTNLISSKPAIIIGPGSLAQKYFPEIDLDKFGPEELVMRVKGNKLLLAGGRPRGTIYAVNRFLQEQCGVRWWTPWATNLPQQSTLKISNLNVREKPAFEYRGPYWFPAFDPLYRVHNCANNENREIPKNLGGCIKYKGFCHTFYPLVSPEKNFQEHPEWFSLVKGKRTHESAQLCLTNPQLRDFMVKRVKEWLRESPDCEIISVTQNDNDGWCECPNCQALDDAEGSHAGTMITFANYIAEKIEKEFPHVWVDTFAYTYTRKPPKTVKARSNVIVRLCSIECNFRESFDHPSNAAFADDIKKWSAICAHLYVWDYTTEFKNYVHPHPNWFTLGDNARFFQRYGVKGFFSEGAYAGHGAEMAELRGWLLSQLMWNPQQDDRKLIREFLDGYYGKAAAKPIFHYLELLYNASKNSFVGCYLRKDPPTYLNFDSLNQSELLWRDAEKAAAADPEKFLRVRVAHLPVRCAFLRHWSRLRHECWEQNQTWPLNESRKVVAEEFRAICQGVPGKDWTQVRVLSEGGLLVEDFLKAFADDPPLEKIKTPAPVRLKNPPPPSDLPGVNAKRSIDLQDNVATLYQPGQFAEILPDKSASDLRACWMPGDHAEWAFRISGANLPAKAQNGRWKIYAVVRVEKMADCKTDSVVFAGGVYNTKEKNYPAGFKVKAHDAGENYRSYLIGTVEINPDRDIWIAPAKNPGVKAIWIDRVYLIAAP